MKLYKDYSPEKQKHLEELAVKAVQRRGTDAVTANRFELFFTFEECEIIADCLNNQKIQPGSIHDALGLEAVDAWQGLVDEECQTEP